MPRLPTLAVAGLGLATLLASSHAARAATPGSGSLSSVQPDITWSGKPGQVTANTTCGGPNNSSCDNFLLTITPPSWAFSVDITATPSGLDDYDLEVYDSAGHLVGNSGQPPGTAERVTLVNPAAGTYTVSVVNYVGLLPYAGQAKILAQGANGTSSATSLGFAVYPAPPGIGESAGEPSIGVNWKSGNVFYIAELDTLRVRFDDCVTPAQATWEDKSFLTTSLLTLDPILFTDPVTGRTFVSQLASKCSSMAYTDDDGESWLPSLGCGINSGVDHQTVGGGPFAPPLTRSSGGTLYPHAVYYCSQDAVTAQCAVSLDGGVTFGPAIPIYNLTQCGGLHGHVKVGPDGTAFVPNKSCGGRQAVVVSTNNGLTWQVRPVPGTVSGAWDPAAAVGSDGTLYMGMASGGHPYVAVSYDHGTSWQALQDVGRAFGIQNTAFPVMVAGDGDRAAFGFLGSAEAGDAGGTNPASNHVWYPYVAITTDRGRTWSTVNVSPGDPVQRGDVCAQGTTCSAARNLLDFNDMAVDREGRILFAYADGCVGACAGGPPNTAGAKATIARQTTGPRLFAAYDGTSSCH
jgi:hypothetical protein